MGRRPGQCFFGGLGQLLDELGDELKLYVRQWAWLSTAPKAERKPGLADIEAEPRTRREEMEADGLDPAMPDVRLPHLFDRLMEIGPVDFAGMDRVPVGWSTIRDWSAQTQVALTVWEARLMRSLSGEWLAETRRAAEVDCPAPFATNSVAHRDVVNRKLAAIFGD